MSENKKTSKFKVVKELMKTSRGKALVFFGAYFIFFLVLAIVSRLGGNSTINSTLPDFDKINDVSTEKIENGNYDFTYSISIDGNMIIYSGSRDNNEELFNYNNGISNTNYYKRDESYFTRVDGAWVKAENPYIYKVFLDSDIYNDLFNEFTYISKISYQDGRESYNYHISTTSIIKKLESIDLDLDDLPNEVVVSSDNDGNVNKIEMNFSSYGIFKGICSNNFSIVLAYSNFGEAVVVSPVN